MHSSLKSPANAVPHQHALALVSTPSTVPACALIYARHSLATRTRPSPCPPHTSRITTLHTLIEHASLPSPGTFPPRASHPSRHLSTCRQTAASTIQPMCATSAPPKERPSHAPRRTTGARPRYAGCRLSICGVAYEPSAVPPPAPLGSHSPEEKTAITSLA